MRRIGEWRTLWLLTSATLLIAATYGLVRFAYGLFLPDVQAELGFDATTAGLVSSGSSLAYCLAAVASFFLASRHPRSLVTAAAAGAAIGAAGMAASGEVAGFAAFAVLSSTGAGFASPALVRLVARNVPRDAVDRSQASVNAGTGRAGGGAVILTAKAMSRLSPRAAWCLTTALVAAASVTIGLLPHLGLVALAASAVFGWAYVAASGSLIAWTTQLDETRAPAGAVTLLGTLAGRLAGGRAT